MLQNINQDLVGAWSGNVPEYPDNPAGTTYLQDAWATVDGWSDGPTGDSTLSVSGGRLISTVNSGRTTWRADRAISAGSAKTYRLKLFSVKSGNVGILANVGAGLALQVEIPIVAYQEKVIDYYIAGNVNRIQFRQSSLVAGDYASIDWVYIGDGTYSSRALDLSGNGNHAQIFGATPVEGGFRFDKVNDYLRIPNFPMPDIYTFRARFVNNVRDAANLQVFHGYGAAGGARLSYYRNVNSEHLVVIWWDGTNTQLTTINNLFSNVANDIVDCVFSINWTTRVLTISRNGVAFSTNTLTNAVKPALNDLFLGNQAALLSNESYGGILQYPRIYNRALTAAEITALYEDPAAYAVDNVTRATTAVPGSIATRDANGDSQFRRIISTAQTGTEPLSITSTTQVTNLNASQVGGLAGSDLMRITGTVAQTVDGVKTFSSIPVLPSSNPTTADQATRKAYVDGLDAANVKLTGAQTVAGVKTFSSIPVLPASNPTAVNEATRKAYVDTLDGANVKLTGDQTIGGNKTFSVIPTLPATNPTASNQAVRKGYIDGLLPGKITISTSSPSGGADGDIWFQV